MKLLLILFPVFLAMVGTYCALISNGLPLPTAESVATSLHQISKRFSRTVTLPLKFRAANVSIVYGNSSIGFYRRFPLPTNEDTVTFKFLPPSYKQPIEFFQESAEGDLLPLAKRS